MQNGEPKHEEERRLKWQEDEYSIFRGADISDIVNHQSLDLPYQDKHVLPVQRAQEQRRGLRQTLGLSRASEFLSPTFGTPGRGH